MSYSYYFCILLLMSLFHFCLPIENFNHVLCKDLERQALLNFKHGLIDRANKLASWVGEDKECCSWAGIVCDNYTGHVHQIHLRGLDGDCLFYKSNPMQVLEWDLSPSLLHLKQLRHLDLSCNDFGGIQVPSFIGSLENLRYLNLSFSRFGATIPPQLGNLSNLHVLCLENINDLTYESTRMLNMRWLSSLHLLRHLDLSGMDLSKAVDWLQVINTLPSLVELQFSNCHLGHAHPRVSSSINNFRNLSSLKLLDISHNDFMCSSSILKGLSSSIGSNLISLDISSCDVSSSQLVALHNFTSLLSLDLSGNQLTKALPKSLGNFCNLREIDLSFNHFDNITLTYLLKSFFECKSPSLESPFLQSAQVSGHIPVQLGQLIHLVDLNLEDNMIDGIIPNSIGQLSFMRSLQLRSNLVSGLVPKSIGELSSLEMLDLSNNRLNGSLPDNLGQISKLNHLDLSDNQLNDNIPDSLGQLSKLNYLDVSSNLLTGVVTEAHFAKLSGLKYLDVTGNNLILRPQLVNWIPPFQLHGLYLRSWDLGPQFPLWLQLQRDLEELDISNTNISTSIPRSFWSSFPNLYHLDLSQNHIQGTLFSIPATFLMIDLSSNEFTGQLPYISNGSGPMVLDLSNNLFGGSLHDMLCPYDEKVTEVLSLGNNNLLGVIPECWVKWTSLLALNLENNNLSGELPRTLGFLSNLQALNMHGNKLSGRLPASLMNLTNLLFIQLGRNELVGSIPRWLGTVLSSLTILYLRSNDFDGNIPWELCHLTYMQILDLAHNNLSGPIYFHPQ